MIVRWLIFQGREGKRKLYRKLFKVDFEDFFLLKTGWAREVPCSFVKLCFMTHTWPLTMSQVKERTSLSYNSALTLCFNSVNKVRLHFFNFFLHLRFWFCIWFLHLGFWFCIWVLELITRGASSNPQTKSLTRFWTKSNLKSFVDYHLET